LFKAELIINVFASCENVTQLAIELQHISTFNFCQKCCY